MRYTRDVSGFNVMCWGLSGLIYIDTSSAGINFLISIIIIADSTDDTAGPNVNDQEAAEYEPC